MPDEAVIDAPVEEVVADISVDTAADTADVSADTGQDSSDNQGDTDSGESLRGSALWRDVKSATQAGKPLNPKQLSALNKVIHRSEAIESKYPEGLSAIEQRMASLKPLIEDEAIPFEEAIQKISQERAYFREFDNLFTSGKPEFVDKLSDASPEAFQNIAPAVFRKYAEVNPDGYSAYVAQAVVSHMNSAQVPMQFQVLEAFWPQVPDFPGKQQFQKALASVIDWTDSLKGMAAKKIEQKAIPGTGDQPAGPEREQQLAQREMNVTRMDWNASVKAEGVSFVMSEAQKAAGKVALSEKERQTVLAKVGEELEARLTADKRYGEAMQGYLKANNRSSYLQRIQSERKKLIPGAVRRAVDDVIAARPKAAPKAPAAQNSAPRKTSDPALTGAVQFRRIAGPPRTLGMTVDLGKTTHAMLEKRQAFIKGEKNPVQWGPLARA
jgi:hypothetical protein